MMEKQNEMPLYMFLLTGGGTVAWISGSRVSPAGSYSATACQPLDGVRKSGTVTPVACKFAIEFLLSVATDCRRSNVCKTPMEQCAPKVKAMIPRAAMALKTLAAGVPAREYSTVLRSASVPAADRQSAENTNE